MRHRNPARRHHYVPRFYLRGWVGDRDGLWVYGRNPLGKLFLKRRPDKAVGYLEDLYTLRPEGAHHQLNYDPDAIEREFFSKLDNDAAVVYAKLIADGPSAISRHERQAWALFLNSLLERNPRRLRTVRQALPALIEKRKREWSRGGRRQALEPIDVDAVAHNQLLLALVRYIKDPEFIDYVSSMEWRVVCLREDSEDHFLTSDSPLVVNGGLQQRPIELLSIALTPKQLLVMYPAAAEMDLDVLGKMAMMHGFQVVTQAEKHVFSSREIRDGTCVKYLKGVEELFATGGERVSE